jgi:hypothetical protein
MRRTEFFTVQRCRDPQTLSFGPPTTLEASSALEAAEKALGMTLSVIGDRSDLAGRVLRLTDDYKTTTTMVFTPRTSE